MVGHGSNQLLFETSKGLFNAIGRAMDCRVLKIPPASPAARGVGRETRVGIGASVRLDETEAAGECAPESQEAVSVCISDSEGQRPGGRPSAGGRIKDPPSL